MDTISFSVVIPTYNRALLISKTIESVLSQTYSDFEIVIVDDGSTDNTSEVIHRKFSNEKKVRYFKKENEERGKARNFGLKKSIGDYVVFFDSDDKMLSNYLSDLATTAKEGNANFIAAKYIIVNQQGQKVADGNSKYPPGTYGYLDFLKGNFLACNFAIKRMNNNLKLFENDRNYAILEDWMFLIENLRNDHLILIDKIGIQMLEHDNRSMTDNQIVIERRKRANETLLNRVNLNQEEQRTMSGYSYYFCGIHSYLDLNRSQCFFFIKKAYKLIGLKKELIILFLKNILGFKAISKLKF